MDHSHEHSGAPNEGFAPDHQPMATITVSVVVISLFVIGLGFALAQLLGVWAQRQIADVQGSAVDGRLTATRQAAQAVLSSARGEDAETKALHMPVDDAVKFLAANPDKIATKALWPELEPQDDPNAAAPAAAPAGAGK